MVEAILAILSFWGASDSKAILDEVSRSPPAPTQAGVWGREEGMKECGKLRVKWADQAWAVVTATTRGELFPRDGNALDDST